MKKLFIFFCLSLIVINCFSQEKLYKLKGCIKNDSIDISNINILNKNLKMGTISDALGEFVLPVRVGDSILISAIHIKNRIILISNTIIIKKSIEVIVDEELNELDEIVIKNNNLTGNLYYDIKKLPKDPFLIDEKALDFSNAWKTELEPDLLERQHTELTHLANTDPTRKFEEVNILGGLSLLVDLFVNNRKAKTVSKNKNTPHKDWKEFKNKLIYEYGVYFFTNDLKIPEEKIDDFFEYCKDKKDIVLIYNKESALDLIDFFIIESKNYNGNY